MRLRPYQRQAIDDLYAWLEKNDGHPCLVLPTGSGKSVIIAELCREAVQTWPGTRLLMMTHVKELIEQNADKLLRVWPNAPLGVYSASIGRRELSEPITFAGVQSIRGHVAELGRVDLCIVDEAHLISHKDEGVYRQIAKELEELNPAVRVIGLTATPYRLGHGLITEGSALFNDLIEPVKIRELIESGYLCKLRSKATAEKLTVEGVHKRGGEYIEAELQAAVDKAETNKSIASEIVTRAKNEARRRWLVFCAGVKHAEHMRDELRSLGVVAEMVTGATPKKEREALIKDFREGRITALTNAMVLTTGFDAPETDLVVLLRPTMSPGLYMQMVGRGLRLKKDTDYCLVLDFAGVIAQHGPVVSIIPPEESGTGDAPVKVCPKCGEIIHAAVMVCPACGHEFPPKEKEEGLRLRDDDIMGESALSMKVAFWEWQIQTSRSSGIEMLVCSYYDGKPGAPPIKEYYCIWHGGRVADKAQRDLAKVAKKAGVFNLEDTRQLTNGTPPEKIFYKKDGKFYRVTEKVWPPEEEIPF